MKVIFLNTWHGKLHDELRNYVQKHVDSTDVFCFEEAHTNDRASYEHLLGDFSLHYAQVRYNENDTWYANSIFIRKDIDIIDTGDFFIDDASLGLATYVKVKDGDRSITICAVHGIPLPGDKLDTPERIYQTKTLIEAFAEDEHVIIGGDFNLLPETQSVQLFAQHGYQDLIKDYAIPTTRNRLTYERYPDSIQYHADYAFVKPALSLASLVVPAEVVSDHQPLEVEVNFNRTPTQSIKELQLTVLS